MGPRKSKKKSKKAKPAVTRSTPDVESESSSANLVNDLSGSDQATPTPEPEFAARGDLEPRTESLLIESRDAPRDGPVKSADGFVEAMSPGSVPLPSFVTRENSFARFITPPARSLNTELGLSDDLSSAGLKFESMSQMEEMDTTPITDMAQESTSGPMELDLEEPATIELGPEMETAEQGRDSNDVLAEPGSEDEVEDTEEQNGCVEEIQGEQELETGDIQLETSQAKEQGGDLHLEEPQVEESQVEELQVEESQVEELPVEERQAEDSQTQELLSNELAAGSLRAGPVEELPTEESSIEESKIEGSHTDDSLFEQTQTEELATEPPLMKDSQPEESVEVLPVVEELAVEESNVEGLLADYSQTEELPVEESRVEELASEEQPNEVLPSKTPAADSLSFGESSVEQQIQLEKVHEESELEQHDHGSSESGRECQNSDEEPSAQNSNSANHVGTTADPMVPGQLNLTMMAPEPESYESNTHRFSDYSRMSPTEDDIQKLSSDLDTTMPSFFKKRTASTSSRKSLPVVEVVSEPVDEPSQSTLLSPTLEIALSPVSTPLRSPSPLKTPPRVPATPLHQHLATVRSMSPSSSNMEIRPFEKRFETRISSLLKRSGHSRNGSELTSRGSSSHGGSPHNLTSISDSHVTDSMSWTKLHNISNQIYSESGQQEFGEPSALLVTNTICVGTKNGTTLIFDYQQNLKKALSFIDSAVTCLAVSSDATILAVGHECGHVITWDLNSFKNDLVIPPESRYEGAVLEIAFVGKRHSCLVSGNVAGKVYLHDGYTGITGRKTRSACIMGQTYPATGASKPTSLFACAALPLGSVSSTTDGMGLVAIMTPHILAIISTTPTVMTQFKIGRPKNINPTLGFIGALAWYPAVRSNTSVAGSDKPILAYSWANIVTILEIQGSGKFGQKIKFTSIARHMSSESIVSLQWINRQVLGLVTATQSLLLMRFGTKNELLPYTTIDLFSKHILKFDRFSTSLGSLRIAQKRESRGFDDDDDNSVPAVPLDSYSSTICTFKGRVFLLGCYELAVGYTLSWYDKIEILVKQGQYLKAVQLALAYYENVSSGDGVVVGLPADDNLRRAVVKPAILEVIQLVLPRALKSESQSLDLAELTCVCVDALIDLGESSIDNIIYDMFEDSKHFSLYLDTISTAVFDLRLRSVSPRVFKALISTYSTSKETTDKVEEIVCTLEPSTLDVDTTLTLCRKYGLLDASVYIWNVALNDYISPLSEFFNMICEGGSPATSNRVYTYLSYLFSGRVYPTGLKMATPQKEIEAKSSLYYVLLIGNFIMWPKIGGKKIPSLVPSDEYPYLKSLIAFNPGSFFVALDEAFEDHFLNDNVEQASESAIEENFFLQGGVNGVVTSSMFSEEVAFGRNINRQMIVDILLQIGPELSPECHIYTLIFIARNYPKYSQFIMLGEGILQSILERLCVSAPEELRQECELAVEILVSKFRPFDLQWTISLLSEAGYNGALSYIYRAERLFPKLVSHCFATELFNDIFEVVEKSFEETSGNTSAKSAKDRTKIEESLRNNFSQLIRLSPNRTVALVSEWCPRLHAVILDETKFDKDQQLMYLKSYFHNLRVNCGGSESPKPAFWTLFISLLAQKQEDVYEQLETEVSALDFDIIVIENVKPVLLATNNIECLVLLLQKKKRFDEALDYLLKEINSTEVDNLQTLVEAGARVCNKDESLWNKFLSGLKSEEAITHGFQQLSTELVSYKLVHKVLLSQENTSARVVKSVVLGVTDNYKFKIRFLQLAKEILDASTYSLMMKDLEKQRLRGWKVGSANCDACGKPIYGKGVNGVTLYKAWQQAKIRSRQGKMVFKNKGKESCNGERIDGQLTDRVVVFKCGHVFHLRCMTRLGVGDEIRCLICGTLEYADYEEKSTL